MLSQPTARWTSAIVAALLAFGSAPALLAFVAAPASAITITPGVIFQPSDSWANISFASSQSFSTVTVDATGVTFDGVRFGVGKSPQALPRVEIVIATWTPSQSVSNQTAVRFTADSPSGSMVVFSLSNVISAREYVLEVDGTEEARTFSDGTGFVFFGWSTWSLHDFSILLGWRTGLPPPPPPLLANFTYSPPTPEAGEAVSFSAGAEGGTPPYSFSWDFGDGFTGSGPTASHTYASAGGFTVALKAADSGGQNVTVTDTITVRAPPPPPLSANFTFAPPDPATGEAVSFSAAAAGGTPPYSYAWDFGDGFAGSGSVASHAYASAGDFTVNLTASDSGGQDAVVTGLIAVREVPPPPALTANFTFAPTSPEVGELVSFTAVAARGTPPYSFSWDFGDGVLGSGLVANHTYESAGNFTVNLTVTDSAAETAVVLKVIRVRSLPPPPPAGNVTAAFSYTRDGRTVTFIDESTSDVGLPITSWFWDFGDDTSSRNPGPTHTYAVHGFSSTYTVILVACDSAGHCGSTSQALTFYNWPLIGAILVGAVQVAGVLIVWLFFWRRRKRPAEKRMGRNSEEGIR